MSLTIRDVVVLIFLNETIVEVWTSDSWLGGTTGSLPFITRRLPQHGLNRAVNWVKFSIVTFITCIRVRGYLSILF